MDVCEHIMSAIDLEDIKRKVYALRVTDLHEVITKLRLSKRGTCEACGEKICLS